MNARRWCVGEVPDAEELARQLTWDETLRFCELAGIPRPH